ncbi:MAG: DUF2851 family protein [Rikenellaceae bacterium]|nr:DUF2851 family protein [Rikenellaceae bacterium]
MNALDHSHLIATLWRMGYFVNTTFTGEQGENIVIQKAGEESDNPLIYNNACICIDGKTCMGNVMLGSAVEDCTSAILRLVEESVPRLMSLEGELIPQAVVTIPQEISTRYEELINSDIKECPCGKIVAAMDSLHKTDLFTRLVVSRLQRKCHVVERAYIEGHSNWCQAMYAMLFRAMGDHKNQEAFQLLANKVPIHILSRERGNGNNVEIMLVGASGLLKRYCSSSHTRQIMEDFAYLARKHSIVPMRGGEWVLKGINPNNHPLLRISQLAAYVSNTNFIFDKIIACRNADDIQALLGSGEGKVSEYWQTHFTPNKRTSRRPKTLGRDKINLLGINLAVPLIFAYGRYLQNEETKERALDLLEKLKVESNYITRHWTAHGVTLSSSFDSQAVIELENSFCANHNCWKCPIGRKEIKKAANIRLIQKK